jgi:hypothetical protein
MTAEALRLLWQALQELGFLPRWQVAKRHHVKTGLGKALDAGLITSDELASLGRFYANTRSIRVVLN